MKKNRRTFLQVAGTYAAGSLLVPQLACNNAKSNDQNASIKNKMTPQPSLDKFGIQLWTLKDEMYKDPKGVLKQLASFGYKQIESFDSEQSMFWNMSNKDFKKYMDDLGLELVASHCDIKVDFERKVAEAAEIGMEYLVCPWIGPQTSMDNWKKITDRFNECGDICKKNGIKFAYHNHAYSFKAFSGMIPHQYMMDNTNPDTVDFEMDIYWVVTGGADPIEYLNKYPNRFRLCHIKDRLKTVTAEEEEASCTLGTGSIDFPKILKVAKDKGMKYFIAEQERYDGSTPLKTTKANSEYLKNLVFS